MTVSGVIGDVVRRYDDSRVTISPDNLVTITPLGLTAPATWAAMLARSPFERPKSPFAAACAAASMADRTT